MRLFPAKPLIFCARHQTANLFVILWQRAVYIIVPCVVHTPSALGKNPVLRIQPLCRLIGIASDRREKHRYPVLLALCAKKPLAGSDAVPDKLHLELLVRNRIKRPVMAQRMNMNVGFPIIAHRLQIFEKMHILDRFRTHAAKQRNPVSALLQHLSAHPVSVHSIAKPRLVQVKRDFELHPELRARHIALKPARRPKQRQRVAARCCPAMNLNLWNLFQFSLPQHRNLSFLYQIKSLSTCTKRTPQIGRSSHTISCQSLYPMLSPCSWS